jgi:hypothetical protein
MPEEPQGFRVSAVGAIPVDFYKDSLTVVVPLSLINKKTGLVKFGFIVGVQEPENRNYFTPFDFVPDSVENSSLINSTVHRLKGR